jgi:polar amino acid transport system substrate-binding protein
MNWKRVARRWVALLLVVGLLALAGQAGASGLEDARRRGKLLAGVKTDSPPFGYVDSAGVIQGFDVDIARHLARALFDEEGRLELVPITSGSRIPFLYSDWIDIIVATMSVTDERRQVLDFTEPYCIAGSMLLVPKDSPIKGIEDLAGKTVAVIEGAVQEKDLAQGRPCGIPKGRVANTRTLLLTAAVIMSTMLILSSFVTTLLIGPADSQELGAVS